MADLLTETTDRFFGSSGTRRLGQATYEDTLLAKGRDPMPKKPSKKQAEEMGLPRQGKASALQVIQIGDGPRTYALQVAPLQYIKIHPAEHADELALLRQLRPDLDELQGREPFPFHPGCPVSYGRVDNGSSGHATFRLKLLSVTPLAQTAAPTADLPAWADSEEALGNWLTDQRAGLPWVKEVLGEHCADWPKTRKACEAQLKAARVNPPEEVLSTVVDTPAREVWSAEKPVTPDFMRAQVARLHFANELAKIGPDLDAAWQEKLAVQPYAGIQASIDAVGITATVDSLEARLRYLRVVPPTARDEYIPVVEDTPVAKQEDLTPTKENWIQFRNDNDYTNAEMVQALGLSELTITQLNAWRGDRKKPLADAKVVIDAFKAKRAEATAAASAFNDMLDEEGASVTEEDSTIQDKVDAAPEEHVAAPTPPVVEKKPAAKVEPKPEVKPEPAAAKPPALARPGITTLTGVNVLDIQAELDKPLHPASYAEMPYGKNKGETYIKRIEFLRDRLDKVFGPCGAGWSMQPHSVLGSTDAYTEERIKDGKPQTWHVSRLVNWTFKYAILTNGNLTWVETTVTSAEGDNMDRDYARKGAETTLMKRFYRQMGGQNHLVYHRYTFQHAQRDLAEIAKKRAA